MRIAIVGAGMAGLACADALVGYGYDISLFDKARGPGGRMSTRRIATPLGEASFDHGAQYFTVRDTHFKQVVADWSLRGLARRWPLAGRDAWIGVPGMNAVIRDMARGHDTRYGQTVQGAARTGRGWRLAGEHLETECFDAMLLALPAEQAATLLGPIDLAMARHAVMARSQPCWTGMFAFAERLLTDSLILRNTGLIGWAARNSAKPGRDGPEAWVVQATGSWSAAHLEDPPAQVEARLLAAMGAALDLDMARPIASAAHRWRYAMSRGLGEGALWNAQIGVGACGDWLLGPRVESAWLSGRALAERVRGDRACHVPTAPPVSEMGSR